MPTRCTQTIQKINYRPKPRRILQLKRARPLPGGLELASVRWNLAGSQTVPVCWRRNSSLKISRDGNNQIKTCGQTEARGPHVARWPVWSGPPSLTIKPIEKVVSSIAYKKVVIVFFQISNNLDEIGVWWVATWGTGPIRRAWPSLPRDLISVHHKNDSWMTDRWDLEHKGQWAEITCLDVVQIKVAWGLQFHGEVWLVWAHPFSEDEPWRGCGSSSGVAAAMCTPGSLDKVSHCTSDDSLDPGSKQLQASEAAICCCLPFSLITERHSRLRKSQTFIWKCRWRQ